jgi:hypothetical protein
MRVLVLVIVSFDKPVYYDMLRLWRERVLNNDCFNGCVTDGCVTDGCVTDGCVTDGCVTDGCVTDVWFIQCKSANEWIGDIVNDIGDTNLRDRFELDIANKTLFIRGDECLIPGILHKTVEALSYFLSFDYNFVWRTNLSSVLDFEGLQRYLGTIRSTGFYGGYVGKTVSEIWFASGAGFLMSRDVAEYLVLNKDLLRWDLIDDVAIGALLEPRYGIVPIERCWIQSGEEVVGSDVFHYRCESYQHLRTVEFMQYVVRALSK